MTTPDHWRIRTVDDLCLRVTSGGTPNRSNPEYYEPATVPWVKTGDLTDAYIRGYGERISEAGVRASSAKVLPPGTVLMAMYGATVGMLGMLIEEATCNQAACAMIANPDTCDPRWLFYALLNDREFIVSQATGAAQQNLSGKTIRQFEYPTPPLYEQKAIAEVLGALDDKIAANTKLAITADELATTLFRQALTSATYTEEAFADVAKVSGGGTPSTKEPEYWDGNVSWATPTDITALSGPYLERTSRTISEAGLSTCASELYPVGSILMTSRATIGAFALAQVPTAVNQGFIVVQPNDPSIRFWIFHEMRSRVDEFISLSNGATFLELSRGNFKKFKVRKASQEIMRSFDETATVLHDTARTALSENGSLAATRDALLPQLMSGKLRVKEAEEIVAAAI